jgi:hypothetical protein
MALTCSRSIVVFACNVSDTDDAPRFTSPSPIHQISDAMPSITRLFACEITEAPSSIVFVGHTFVFVGDCQGSIHVFELASASKTNEILPSAALRAAILFMSSSRKRSCHGCFCSSSVTLYLQVTDNSLPRTTQRSGCTALMRKQTISSRLILSPEFL